MDYFLLVYLCYFMLFLGLGYITSWGTKLDVLFFQVFVGEVDILSSKLGKLLVGWDFIFIYSKVRKGGLILVWWTCYLRCTNLWDFDLHLGMYLYSWILDLEFSYINLYRPYSKGILWLGFVFKSKATRWRICDSRW